MQDLFLSADYDIRVVAFSGARSYRAAELAGDVIRIFRPAQIYILAGVNNLTLLDRRSRKIRLSHTDGNVIVQQFTHEMNLVTTLLSQSTKPGTKVIFAPITGLNMASYNREDPRLYNFQQSVIDQAVIGINNLVIEHNANSGYKTPWTHSIIHRYFRKKYHFSYERLDADGCHLTDDIRAFWARKILSAVVQNDN